MVEMGEEETREVGMETLVTRDELVGECQAWHKTTLLEPEDGRERSAEEDTLDGCECDEPLSKGRVLILDPLDSPVGLFPDAGNYTMSVTTTGQGHVAGD